MSILDTVRKRLFFALVLPFLLVACKEVNSLSPRTEKPIPTQSPATPSVASSLPTGKPILPTETLIDSTEIAITPGVTLTNSPSNTECQESSDCALGVRIDRCCACPRVMSRDVIMNNDDIILYEQGQNYSDQLPASCGNVDCAPCPPPPVPVCTENSVCEAQLSPIMILEECPDCYAQAALAAYGNGEVTAAIEYCHQADPPSCLTALFDTAFASGDLEGGLKVCLDSSFPDTAGCLTALAVPFSALDIDRAVSLCQQIPPDDIRYFGCIVDVATAVQTRDPESAQEICHLLNGERVDQCLEELD